MARHRKPRRKTPRTALAAVLGGVAILGVLFFTSPSVPHSAAPRLPSMTLRVPAPAAAVEAPAPVQAVLTYVVKSGDTLSGIAQHECHDQGKWRELASASHIGNVNMLKIGEVITLSC